MQKQTQSLVITDNGTFVGFLNVSKNINVEDINLDQITQYFNKGKTFKIEHPKDKETPVAPWE